ncbi:hypothetical protein AAG570_001108 [Ranatra chinensis]|uniref:Uncharacterized protein n=1 Tax=Ranatra chinensis TaxID=642074 RepID=A0ABD0YMM7_9HEMI
MKTGLLAALLPITLTILTITIDGVNGRKTVVENMPLVRRLDGTVADDLIEATLTFHTSGDVQVDFRAHMKFSKTDVIHLFVANESMAITEILFYPENTSKSVAYSAPYMVVSKHDSGPCNYTSSVTDGQVSAGGGNWTGSALCPVSVLPASATRYSLAAEQTSNDKKVKHHLCFYTVNNAEISIPDFMVFKRYKVIGEKY